MPEQTEDTTLDVLTVDAVTDATDSSAADVVPTDETLVAAVEVARAALLTFTPEDTIGEPLGHIVEGDRVVSLLFDCTMTGYPGWRWTVTLSRIDGESVPQVLETELTPGDEALVAPEWVPWSDRLADYRTAQDLVAATAAADALGDDDADDDDDDDDDDSDDDDDDDDDSDDDDTDDDDDEEEDDDIDPDDVDEDE
ncbi:DUF3027 domain-containing protein [Cryobacterium zhongshanensis]|uniref:DUF3027 domain-containing protein n=1 Tax=Cryobacterium zhongshanensis TaxID=2928153 RepID=A0AA41UE57_9MICO|nr:DUF3027 domain-containing protein [Cryobacterium zhongshanensis]MCI4656677.1 DUF3027 domain-containing protein [Cryobacterium zhongshanensis]